MSAAGRLRIAVVSGWYPDAHLPGHGPGVALRTQGVFVREQALAAARHHDVSVVHLQAVSSPVRGLYRIREDRTEPLPTVRAQHRALGSTKLSAIGFVAGAFAAFRYLRSRGWQPDIVHAHVYAAGFAAVLVGRRLGVPVLVTEHLTDFPAGRVDGSSLRVARFAFERAALVTPVSEDLRAHIEALGIRARFRVVPNVVDVARFYPNCRSPAGRVRFLVVANLERKKGIVDLLDALALLHERGEMATLDIVGEGPERPGLEARAHVLGLRDSVRFHGPRSKEEVADHMRAADVFVLPSLVENLPCVLIEALASGLPIVATRVGGVPEIVDDSNGVLVPPGDAARLALAMSDVALRRDSYDPLELARTAATRYSVEAVGRVWDELYRSLATEAFPRTATTR